LDVVENQVESHEEPFDVEDIEIPILVGLARVLEEQQFVLYGFTVSGSANPCC
jgi:hypothetical protein